MQNTRRQTIAPKPVTDPGGIARTALAITTLWVHRTRTRRCLAALDPRELADIGRTEPERRRECAKWFWQG
jgi:uncharacterized protein YjiS (DUF1127 family)